MEKVREWMRRHKATFYRVAHVTEAISLVLLIALGGAVGGFMYAEWRAHDVMVQERADHLAEIDRLQGNYTQLLQVLTPKIKDIAETASSAAESAAAAAATTAEVATAAKRATGVPTPLTEAERSKANAAINDANRRLREVKK